jgi:hypothetical protein
MNQPPILQKPDRTPLYLAAIGLLILVAFLTVHLLGWRQHTAWLSGTPTPGSQGAFAPLTYAGLYFLAWFLAPIYLLASLIYCALFLRNKKSLEIQKSPDILPPSQTT